MKVRIVTLFPELFGPFLETSFVKKAIATGELAVHLEPLRRHGLGKHLAVDDTPYGGGAGMVLRVDCVAQAIEAAEEGHGRTHRVLMTPQGAPFRQATAAALVARSELTLLCGRYEGFDERVRTLVDEEISLGDFVLAGGEVPAMAVIECCVRLLPGVLGNEASIAEESFSDASDGLLEYPQYTRPKTFHGLDVPEILTSGDHAKIAAWRTERAVERTTERRPDLISRARSKSR
ncbi:MAG TPA: tRNA (guanosine(37)-N1)-methyltransferase TrmD [Polyangiaceae bacterium]|jgi:tRNA (guanine37-N1)-methyltransferase|nr:tRNA (guanosine(37)-N1)-methyltransferase TrmD [Polyangiaceae bacterium]